METNSNNNETTKKFKNLEGKCTAAPMISKETEVYREAQFFIETKHGKTIKIYAMQKAVDKAMNGIVEGQYVKMSGLFLASDAYRMTSFK